MAEDIKLNWSEWDTAFARRTATSKRSVLELATEQMRGIMRHSLLVTPPGHDGVPGGTREADAHGRAKVMGDIFDLYGTAGDAFALIKRQDIGLAKSFWRDHQRGDEAAAAETFKRVTGQWYGPWDGGRLHKTHFTRGRTAKRRDGRKIIFVSDARALTDYVRDQQDKVMTLTAGWKKAFADLGIPLPQWIAQHNAPVDNLIVEVSDERIRIQAGNSVTYADATDLQRRLQFAIDAQKGAMDRQWEDYQAKLNREAGLS